MVASSNITHFLFEITEIITFDFMEFLQDQNKSRVESISM